MIHKWSVKMTDALMARVPDLSDEWSHEYGVVLKGIEEVWRMTKEDRYLDYILHSISPLIGLDGTIRGYALEDYSLDHLNSGRLLFQLYELTDEDRFKKAAFLLREQYRTHPRTTAGGFWHKALFPHQMFLDGSYMGAPFYAEFIKRYGEADEYDDVTKQIQLLALYTKDEKTGLFYHGYDAHKSQPWADPATGRSPSFWSRAMGWYAMAIIDIIEVLPVEHRDRTSLVSIGNQLLEAVLRYQHPGTGVWHQVTDQLDREGNYFEASASCMFAYALAKGMRLGILPQTHLAALDKAYVGILQQFVRMDDDGRPSLQGTCKSAGLGVFPHRDGSYAYYISEPAAVNDYKGIGAFILASVEKEKLMTSIEETAGGSLDIKEIS